MSETALCCGTDWCVLRRQKRQISIGCGKIRWVGFLLVCFRHKTNPNPRKIICCGEKVAQMPLQNLFFLRLGWPWVGEFVGFIITYTCFPTQHNLVNRKHPITGGHSNQDPPYKQKPIYYHFFANHIWSLLLCSPVITCAPQVDLTQLGEAHSPQS